MPPPGAYPYYGPPPRRATFSSMLSGMFDVWTKGFKEFFLVLLALGLVNGLIGALISFALFGAFEPASGIVPGAPPEVIAQAALENLSLFSILVAFVGFILESFVIGGIAEFSVRRFRGETIPMMQALRRGLDKFPSILSANLLLGLLLFALVLFPALLTFATLIAGGPIDPGDIALLCGGFAFLTVGGLVALYLTIAMILFAPAIMMENTNAVGGLLRSWRIMKGHWWSLFAAFLVAFILSLIITAVIVIPVAFLDNTVVTIVAAAVAEGIIGAWGFILAAVAYDLILREPTYFAPPYYPGTGMAAPGWTGQPPQPPAAPPSPPIGP